MPGDYIYTGTLKRNDNQIFPYNTELGFFHVLTPHGSLTADLQPFPIVRQRTNIRIFDYRCFIPISGNRVLSTVLESRPFAPYIPGTIRITMRVPGNHDTLFWGVMRFEGSGPRWIPRD